MSLRTAAPSAAASVIISGLLVSTLTQKPSSARARTTGRTRRRSSSRETPNSSKPGRVDSPPTSMMSAPSSRMRRACRSAASGVLCSPPSEKESGVTFRIPMMRGRFSISKRRSAQRQTFAFAMRQSSLCKVLRSQEKRRTPQCPYRSAGGPPSQRDDASQSRFSSFSAASEDVARSSSFSEGRASDTSARAALSAFAPPDFDSSYAFGGRTSRPAMMSSI